MGVGPQRNKCNLKPELLTDAYLSVFNGKIRPQGSNPTSMYFYAGR